MRIYFVSVNGDLYKPITRNMYDVWYKILTNTCTHVNTHVSTQRKKWTIILPVESGIASELEVSLSSFGSKL